MTSPAEPGGSTRGTQTPPAGHPVTTHDRVVTAGPDGLTITRVAITRQGLPHDQEPERDEHVVYTPLPAHPPARPKFEFRERPSAVIAQRARTVDVAFGMWTAAAVLTLAAAVLMTVGLDGLTATVQGLVDREHLAESADVREQVVSSTIAAIVGGGYLLSLVLGVAAAAMRAGRGGARFVLVLTAAAVGVSVLLTWAVVAPLVSALLACAVVLGLFGAVRSYLPAANTWFATRMR